MTTPLKREGKTVFLTGTTGYIGSVIAEKLLVAGYKVRGLVRESGSVAELKAKEVDPVVGDVLNPQQMADAAKGAAAIIHTAAPNDPSAQPDIQKILANAAAAISTMVQNGQANDARVIVTGGASIYGNTEGKTVDETAPCKPLMPGMDRLFELEAEISSSGAAHVVRPVVVHGRAQSGPMRSFLEAIKNRGRKVLVDGSNRLSLVHVEDLADLYLSILEHEAPPPIVNGASDIMPWSEIMDAIGDAVGVSERPEAIAPEEAMTLGGPAIYLPIDMAVSGALAREALGWSPSGPSLRSSLSEF